MSRYTWDLAKATSNFRKHGVTFDEADDAASGPLAIEELDTGHSGSEERVKVVGWSERGVLLVVITSVGGPQPRIISARRATKREHDAYTG